MAAATKLLELVKEHVFPIFCLGCEREGEWVCRTCFERLDASGVAGCPVCRKPTAHGAACGDCWQHSSLTHVVAVTPYEESWLIGRLVHAWKYEYASDVSRVVASVLQKFFASYGDTVPECDVIVPVPLHPRRFAERGFNQALVLAEMMGAIANKPVVSGPLIRRRYTERQARLGKDARRDNVKDAFLLKDTTPTLHQRVLLVDDVYTTGSTMQECARVLKAGGTASVTGFVLARG